MDQQLHFQDRDAGLTSGQANKLEGHVNELDVSGAINELDSDHRRAELGYQY